MTLYIVEYKKAFGAGAHPESQTFDEKEEAEWFVKAMKRSNYITNLIINDDKLPEGYSKGD
jgi:hypothetical protein|tara:strand:- start:702 stop:884 length:183 start_codon:yes stop_codon:yes gene_type:complete